MKERNKYHIADIANLIIFYTVFICLFVTLIMGVVQKIEGTLETNKLIYRISLTLLMTVPFLIKKIFKITFSKVVSSIYYIYMFLAGFIGTVLEVYKTWAGWDMVIHFLMGLVIAILSIYILNYTIYKKDVSRHNLFFTFLFMFAFAVGICAVWEILEFVCDLIFDTGFQRYVTYYGKTLIGKDAVFDTMIDLVMGAFGAIVAIVFVYFAQKVSKRFLKTFIIKKLKPKEQEIEDIEE